MTGRFFPIVAAGSLEEFGLLSEEVLWNIEAGGEVGLLFVDDDRASFGEVRQVRETSIRVSVAPGSEILTINTTC